MQQQITEYEDSDPGRHSKAVAKRMLAEAQAGARSADLQTLQEEAVARMTERGDFETFRLGETAVRGATGVLTGVDVKQQRINAEILTDVGRRAAEAGVSPQFDPKSAIGRAEIATFTATEDQLTVNHKIQELLGKLVEMEEKKAGERRKDKNEKPGKPLDAKPAGGDNKPANETTFQHRPRSIAVPRRFRR